MHNTLTAALQRRKDSNLAEERRGQAQQVGIVDRTFHLLDRLNEMRGDGDSAKKRRRFADRSLDMAALSQRVCASRLREAKAQPEEADDDSE